MNRVVDYSRRQRREVQMDLFGRELILPRARARSLHLGGMTASQIADRLGAPFDVVAMQLLDALLLPEIEAAPAQPQASPPKPLNAEQAEAARHRDAPYLLEAGPGTGKTQTLVGRIAGLVDEGVDPHSILVLTFSNKAAGELSDRIAAIRPDAAPAMWIGTFHAFGLDLVRRHHRQLGFPKEPRMMDRSEAIAIMEREYLALDLQHHRDFMDPARPLKDMLGAMSRAKDEVADAERFAALAQQMVEDAVDADAGEAGERCAEVALVYRRYEELKHAACAVDFGDLVSMPVRLLDEEPQTAAALRATYSHTRTATGTRRDASPFIARLGVTSARAAIPHAGRDLDPESLPLAVRIGPPVRITTAQLDLYSRCARRFLYTHVLNVGGRRTPTTMTRMHDLVREVIKEVATTHPSATSMTDMEALLELRWSESPLAAEEYCLHREVATLLLRRFVTIRAGGSRADPGPLVAAIGGDEVTAVADDVVTATGRDVARVVRTGHRSSSTGKALADAAFQMAAAASLPGCTVEIIHLGDDEPTIAVAFDDKALGRNLGKLTEALAAIASGRFEPERSDRTCPFCPAFFTCGPLADGELQKNL